jgi:hypothetical protein
MMISSTFITPGRGKTRAAAELRRKPAIAGNYPNRNAVYTPSTKQIATDDRCGFRPM